MRTNRRGLILLAVLLAVAALVYVYKNQRNNPGSYAGESQQARVKTEEQAPEGKEQGRFILSGVKLSPNVR